MAGITTPAPNLKYLEDWTKYMQRVWTKVCTGLWSTRKRKQSEPSDYISTLPGGREETGIE